MLMTVLLKYRPKLAPQAVLNVIMHGDRRRRAWIFTPGPPTHAARL